MRPAQLTPENSGSPHRPHPALPGFNEAGAINAGKRRRAGRRYRASNRFNEAGAINAGKRIGSGLGYPELLMLQ